MKRGVGTHIKFREGRRDQRREEVFIRERKEIPEKGKREWCQREVTPPKRNLKFGAAKKKSGNSATINLPPYINGIKKIRTMHPQEDGSI